MKQKISLVTPQRIRRHQANTSTAKFSCAFSKQKRFGNPNPECKKAFYIKDNQTSLSKITFKVPKSTRPDFLKDLTCSPPSTKYLHKSSFERSPSKGQSFALGRDHSPDRSYIKKQLAKLPAPNKYFNDVNNKKAVSFSMRPKTTDFDGDRLSFKQSPGPGAYQTIDLFPKEGRFKVSKHDDVKLCKINPNTKRFLEEKHSPSPADYVRNDNFSPIGKFIRSKDRGTGTRPFTKTARTNFTQKFRDLGRTLPGPGQYQKVSDFGIYGDMKYYKTLSESLA